MNKFLIFLELLRDEHNKFLIESVSKAYNLIESVTFSPSYTELMKFDFYKKNEELINKLGNELDLLMHDPRYQMRDSEFQKLYEEKENEYYAAYNALDSISLNVANANAREIIRAMGIISRINDYDMTLSEFDDMILNENNRTDYFNELFDSLKSYDTDLEGSANVYEFELMIDEMESMKHTMIRDNEFNRNTISFGLSEARIDRYINQLRKMVDFCKEYGITTITWG